MGAVGGVAIPKSTALGLALAAVAVSAARAQSADIPLQVVQGGSAVYLVVNVGINGQQPFPYLFDTGSSAFNAEYTTAAFGSTPSNMSSPTAMFPSGLPTGITYSYGDNVATNSWYGNMVGVSSLTFYPTSTGSASGVTLNAVTPSGTPSAFVMNAIYNVKGQTITAPAGQQTSPVFGGFYGIFGAGDFATAETGNANPAFTAPTPVTANTTTSSLGSVLGQAVVPGTTAGYVVAANGQPLSSLQTGTVPVPGSTVNGPQVGQNVNLVQPLRDARPDAGAAGAVPAGQHDGLDCARPSAELSQFGRPRRCPIQHPDELYGGAARPDAAQFS